ncbi:MAG: Uncharacterised protein [Cellulomonadaceae bacterium TMED98]|nr:MAG: Uncharacterised protein [Cellulomonadaceae bacterium TMED98]
MVNDQFCRRERIDFLGIPSELNDGLPHGGQVDNAGHSSEVLENDACGGELDFRRRFGVRVPGAERADLLGGDIGTVFGAQQVFEKNFQTEWQTIGALDGIDPEDFMLGAANTQCVSCSQTVLTRHRILQISSCEAKSITPRRTRHGDTPSATATT